MSALGERSEQPLIAAAKKFGAHKSLGQHFLVDPHSLSQVCAALDLKSGQDVLEIGPGLGFLTELLADSGANVLAVELDARCVRYLNDLKLLHTRIVHQDILNFDIKLEDWHDKDANTQTISSNMHRKIKIVGNIPYQITAPIIVHFFGEIGFPTPWLQFVECVVMTIQKEVAQRLQASPGSKDYGQISLLVNYFAITQVIAAVGRDCFYPPPEVDSAIVKFTPHEKPPVACNNPKLLRTIIKTGFKQRRKMLINNLAAIFNLENCTEVFEELNIDPQCRAENLSLGQFAKLADRLIVFPRGDNQ